jgi:hypothetical protein
MKKLFIPIFIILIGLFIVSCDGYNESPYDTVQNPEQETTLHLLNLPHDTVTIAVDEDMLYVFSLGDDRVVIKTKTIKYNNESLSFIYLFFIHWFLIITLIIIYVKLI